MDEAWEMVESFLLNTFQDPVALDRIRKICKARDSSRAIGALEEVKKFIDTLEESLTVKTK